MLGDSSNTPLGSSSGDAPAPAPVGSGLDGGGGDEFGDRSFGGNRWPRQETIALLEIRAGMDAVFRDASVKGPLWEEVSRKLGELGYQRTAKKCKEKFENVSKYHKRTKEGRTGKPDGKTYRFFDQLAALENQPSPAPPVPIQKPVHQPAVMTSPPPSISVPAHLPVNSNQATIPTATTTVAASNANTNNVTVPITTAAAGSVRSMSGEMMSNSTSSWSSTDVEGEEEETGGRGGNKRKRKWKDFFERLMKEVIGRQEDLQRRFLEAVERREQERASREEAWRLQELSRISRERDILAQERSAAAAKDAAVMAFLHKLSSSDSPSPVIAPPPNNNNNQPRPAKPPPTPASAPAPAPAPAPPMPTPMATPAPPATMHREGEDATTTAMTTTTTTTTLATSTGMMGMGASSSRWPKSEVHDLIKLRTSLETKYQENGPKGPLWEEISAAMRRMGYNRSAKRCKEKWENINKYFKKVKESNKRRPEDSKTCPYFSMLDAIYRDRLIRSTSDNISSVPLMVQPEQQWPPLPPPQPASAAPPPEDEDEDDEEEDEDDEEAAGNNYELVASKPGSVDQ